MNKMTELPDLHSSILAEVRQLFDDASLPRSLRPVEVSVEDGKIVLRYLGFVDDVRGPFGAQFDLPKTMGDEIWSAYSDEFGGIHDWAAYGVVFRVVEIYETSLDQARPNGLEGTWWIGEA